jgi:predicted Zn-dependent peptidase
MRPAWRRDLALALVCVAAPGCGAGPKTRPGKTVTPVEIVRDRAFSLAAIQRPSPGVAHLSLWIDAGSRDAPSAPQLATTAAWIAAARGGSGIRANVTPDGTELGLRCVAAELAQCLGRLAKTLSVRRATEPEARRARSRLAAARDRADAADPGREADRLALRALLGREAEGLFPLGEPRKDKTVTAEALQGFFREHYGRNRALLVAVGDVDQQRLRTAARKAFAEVPAATTARRSGPLDPEDGGLLVSAAPTNHLALVAAVADLDTALAYARALNRLPESDEQQARPVVSTSAFALRGGAFLLLRLQAERPAAVLRRTAFELLRLQQEGTGERVTTAEREGLPELARAAGEGWCTRVPEPERTGAEIAMGVGAVLHVGCGVGPAKNRRRKSDGDTAFDRARGRLQKAFSYAYRLARPRLRGSIAEKSASALAPNGVPIEIRRRADSTVAIAVRFRGGADNDPFALHGRTALLAEAAATACRGAPSEVLQERLQQIGASLHPLVEAASWGLLLTAPARHWQRALDIVLGCALYPSMSTRDLARARLRLTERLGPDGSFLWSQGRAARLVSPGAPGLVAPRGTIETAANVADRELRAFARGAIVAVRMSIAVVGDVPVEEAAVRIARRVGFLPAGTPPSAPASSAEARSSIQAGKCGGSEIRAIAAWRAEKVGTDGAIALASLLRAELNLSAGIKTVDHGGGSSERFSWAWVSALVSEQALDAFGTAAEQAAGRITPGRLAGQVNRVTADRSAAQAAARARPQLEADRLALAATGIENGSPASSERSRAAAEALLREKPLFFIARPR